MNLDFCELKNIVKVQVLVAGDFMLDSYVYGTVKRVSPEAPVPVLEVDYREQRLGGAGNVVNNLLSLGVKVKVLGCVGDDDAGSSLLSDLKSCGADIKHIWTEPRFVTTKKTRIVSQKHQFLRVDEEKIQSVPERYIEYIDHHIEEILHTIDVIVLSDYAKGFLSVAMTAFLIDEARKRGIITVVDPKGSNYAKYRYATICKPNYAEFCTAVPNNVYIDDDFSMEGDRFREQFSFQYLLVTQSEKGMTLFANSDSLGGIHFPAETKEVIDVTGAGDTVTAVISLGLGAGLEISKCCKLANRAASLVVSKFGAATITLNELLGSSICQNSSKVVKMESAEFLAEYLRNNGKKIVFTNGCFDLIHAGHISTFKKARELGDVLIVGVNSDRSISQLKGDKRPIVNEQHRLMLLSALDMIDYLIIFDEETPEELIKRIKPTFLVKGMDWEKKQVVGQIFVESYGGQVALIDLEEGLSTSKIIQKIQRLY